MTLCIARSMREAIELSNILYKYFPDILPSELIPPKP
jgi:hypothetical protein